MISVRVARIVREAWRRRGFEDGRAGRQPTRMSTLGPDVESAYWVGHAEGEAERLREEPLRGRSAA